MHRYGFLWLRRALPMLALALVGALLLTIEEGSADAACAEPPGALASAVNDDASGIVLTWEAPAGCAPDAYAVYRRTIGEAGSRLAKIATVDGAGLTHTDQNVTAGATYRYRVRSNDQGPRSGWTQIVMTEPGPEPAPSTNSAPTFNDGDPATRGVPENSGPGTSVGLAVAATDSDTDDTLAYSLSGTDATSFSINSSTGQLQTKAGVTYDYETKNSYSVTVNVSDSKDAAGEADTAIDDSIDVAIALTDVEEAACAEPPGGLTSAVNDDASGIVLTWEAPAGCAPDAYAVYRRTISEDGSRLAKIATVDGAGLTYTDQNVSAGATYRYRVRSNDQGPRSGWTQSVMTEPKPEPEPEPTERTGRAVLRDAVTLVSNAGQTAGVGIQNVSTSFSYAQGFTTGGSGATLGSVTLDDVSGLTADDAPVVSLYSDSSGSPGTSLATLTAPSTPANGDVTFTVAAGTNVTLAASTPYFIHIANTSGTFTIKRTSSTAEDATSTTGWTIADDGMISASGGTFVPISGLGLRVIKLTITSASSDTTAPTLLTATVDGTTLVLTYDEPLDEDSVPTVNSYRVTVASNSDKSALSVDVSGAQVTLTLEDLAVHGDTVTVSYGPPPTDPLRDAAGNDAAALTNQAVTNNDPAPLLSNWPAVEPAFSSSVGDRNASNTRIQAQKFRTGPKAEGYMLRTVTFYLFVVSAANVAERVSIYTADADGNPGSIKYVLTGDFSDIGHTTFTAPANAVLDPNTDYFVYFEDTLHDTAYGYYSVGVLQNKASEGFAGWSLRNNHYMLNGGAWQEDSSSIIIVHLAGEFAPDNTAPALLTATVDGTSLVLTYNEDLDEDAAPAASAYSVTVGSNSAAAPSAVAVSGSAVTLTLATGATAGDTVMLGYTRPAANPLQDLAGNDAAALSSRTVTNYTGRTNAAPTFDDGATTTRSVNENIGAGVNVGAVVAATDADTGATLTYSLSGSRLFAINPGTGQIRTVSPDTLDHEATASYEVTVGVLDGLDAKGNADAAIDNTITVTININNLDEPGSWRFPLVVYPWAGSRTRRR